MAKFPVRWIAMLAITLVLAACATPTVPASTTVVPSASSASKPTTNPVVPQAAPLTQAAMTVPAPAPKQQWVWVQKSSDEWTKFVKPNGLDKQCIDWFPGSPGPGTGYCGILIGQVAAKWNLLDVRDALRLVFLDMGRTGVALPIPWELPMYMPLTKSSNGNFRVPASYRATIPSGLITGPYWAKVVGIELWPGDVYLSNHPVEFGLNVKYEAIDLTVVMLPYNTLKFGDISTSTVAMEALMVYAVKMHTDGLFKPPAPAAMTVDGQVIVLGAIAIGGVIYMIVTPLPDPGDIAAIAAMTKFVERLSTQPAFAPR